MRKSCEKCWSLAEVVPFPYSHRHAFIERQATRAAELNPDAGERHVRIQIKIQIEAMRRRGISEELIQREARCIESAIRTALWRAVMQPPGHSQ